MDAPRIINMQYYGAELIGPLERTLQLTGVHLSLFPEQKPLLYAAAVAIPWQVRERGGTLKIAIKRPDMLWIKNITITKTDEFVTVPGTPTIEPWYDQLPEAVRNLFTERPSVDFNDKIYIAHRLRGRSPRIHFQGSVSEAISLGDQDYWMLYRFNEKFCRKV